MTVSNLVTKQRFNGNGATVTFAIPFDFSDNSEVAVYLRNGNVTPATQTLKTLGVDYTITGGNPGVNVVMTTAPATGEVLVIIRNVVSDQATNYVSNGAFDAEAHEDALDHIIRAVQELDEKFTRTPIMPATTSITDLTLPEPTALSLLAWNSDGTALENRAVSVTSGTSSGDVVGPASSTSGNIPVFSGTSGKNIIDSSVTQASIAALANTTYIKVPRTVNTQSGTTYTFVLTDGSANGGNPVVTFGSGSATTVTVPPNASVAFAIGTQIDCVQLGAGKVTFAPGSGVTISSLSGNLAIAGQYVGCSLLKTATNTWILMGSLIA